MSPTKRQHGKVENRVAWLITQHVNTHALGEVGTGEVGCKLPNGRVRAPDVLFVPKDRLVDVPEDAFWPFAPNLAVEVISQGEKRQKVRDKVNEWIAAGSDLVWVVDPQSCTVTVYERAVPPCVLGEGDTLEGGAVLPGFSCSVAEIFG